VYAACAASELICREIKQQVILNEVPAGISEFGLSAAVQAAASTNYEDCDLPA
jgi:hypothetical protein